MSTNQYVSEIIDIYGHAKKLLQNGGQRQQKAILKIRSISRDIQDLERSIRKGTILCSSVGLLSSALTMAGLLGAPFTFGGSLSLTALGGGIGICSGAVDIIQTWVNSSEIESKCNEASTLLEVNQDLEDDLLDEAKKLHRLQTRVCMALKIPHMSLSAVGSACGKALYDSMSRNIPHIEHSSKVISYIFQRPETTVYVTVSINSTREVVAPMIGKQAASGISKKSLRVIGSAAVGIAILADVVKIVSNAKALDLGTLSDLVAKLEKEANKMENKMKDDFGKFGEMFATPSSAQISLIKDMSCPPLYNCISK